jgi:hypothetical protein
MNTIELYVYEEKGFSIKVKAEAKGEIGSSILEGFKVDLEDIFRELL